MDAESGRETIAFGANMQFIEMTGKTLSRVINTHEISPEELKASGVGSGTLVRVNRQGDIEVRRPDRWDVIGGLIGDFAERVKQESGLDWA